MLVYKPLVYEIQKKINNFKMNNAILSGSNESKGYMDSTKHLKKVSLIF